MLQKQFVDFLRKRLANHPKTSWGKNELDKQILEWYIEFLAETGEMRSAAQN